MDATRLGKDVRLLRHARGWSQRQLAAQAQISRSTASMIERGLGGDVTLA